MSWRLPSLLSFSSSLSSSSSSRPLIQPSARISSADALWLPNLLLLWVSHMRRYHSYTCEPWLEGQFHRARRLCPFWIFWVERMLFHLYLLASWGYEYIPDYDWRRPSRTSPVALLNNVTISKSCIRLHLFGTKSSRRLSSCWVVSINNVFRFTFVCSLSCANDVVSTVTRLALRKRFNQLLYKYAKKIGCLFIKWHSPMILVLIE